MMNRSWKCFALAAIIAPLMPCALLSQHQEPAGDAKNGERLFVQNGCYECHGYVGQGGLDGVRLAPWKLPAQGLIRYVRHPPGQMPPYTEKVMTDKELIDVVAYLKSIPAPKSAKDIPLLSDGGSK
jgi:ubiquinol-cytochrome c reductase cytochrome c subunit